MFRVSSHSAFTRIPQRHPGVTSLLRRHALTRDTFTECGQLLSSVPVPAFLCMISSMLCLWTFRCHSTYTPPHRDTEVRQARQPDETLKPGL